MTLGETLVAAVILAISSHGALQSRQRLLDIQNKDAQIHTALLLSEQQLLAARRLLRVSPSGSNRVEHQPCEQLIRAWPERLTKGRAPMAGVKRTWSAASATAGLWMEVSVSSTIGQSPLQRRVLFTPAGLGLCGGDQP